MKKSKQKNSLWLFMLLFSFSLNAQFNCPLNLVPGINSIGSDFNGVMITNYPECTFDLGTVSTSETILLLPDHPSFPNPFNDFLHVEKEENNHLEVFNFLRKMVYKNEFGRSGSLYIKTGDWPPEYYFIKKGKTVETLLKI